MGENCPYVYFCNKKNCWREVATAPKVCKLAIKMELPKGAYLVKEERKGFLFVDVDNQTIKIKNPFDYTPKYVRLVKNKAGYRIKKVEYKND